MIALGRRRTPLEEEAPVDEALDDLARSPAWEIAAMTARPGAPRVSRQSSGVEGRTLVIDEGRPATSRSVLSKTCASGRSTESDRDRPLLRLIRGSVSSQVAGLHRSLARRCIAGVVWPAVGTARHSMSSPRDAQGPPSGPSAGLQPGAPPKNAWNWPGPRLAATRPTHAPCPSFGTHNRATAT